MGKFVKDYEAGYIRMLANRILRLSRDAAARGETYQDMSPPTPVYSGHRVRLRFDEKPGGYEPIVEIYPMTPEFVLLDMAELASEVLARPAKLRARLKDHLEFSNDD